MKTVVLIAVLALACVAFAEKTRWHQLHEYSFEKYMKEYNKNYGVKEFAERKEIFESRLKSIMAHNADKTKTWKQGVNHLTDQSEEEISRLLGLQKSLLYLQKSKFAGSSTPRDISSLPPHVDWREKNVITAVKDQGRCGSCWSFGTAETVESHWAISKGELMDLSQQQILDCTPNTDDCGGVGGCGGGTPEIAYAKIMQLGGLSSEWTYPYISYFGADFQCKFNTSTTVPLAKLSGYVVLPSNQYEPVLEAVATKGPLAINVDASAWSAYESGVFDGCNQTNPDIDHVVQLVGYGTDPSFGDYWLVRNSWSSLWGEKGYIRLKREGKPRCGIDLKPQDGTGCNGGPPTVTVCGTCGILYDVSYPIIA